MPQQLTAKQQHWSEILESADNSGLSLTEFARQNQLTPQALYRWRNQLKRHTPSSEKPETRFTRVVAKSYAETPFLTITLHQTQLQFNSFPDPEWLAKVITYQGVPS